MNSIRGRLGHSAASDDSGISVIEIVVAMFLFALIITGTLYTMLSILTTTRDSRNQQVASNLAAQDIDLSRDYADVFKLLPASYTVPLNGDIFTVTRTTEWVSASGNDVQCGTGGAALSYKRVNVAVTWDSMRASTPPVRSDTIVDPKSRITDPTKGTLLVGVKTPSGTGSAGVIVTATPSGNPQGAVTPASNSVITDSSGCAYILRVTPGNYDITVSHSPADYVNEKQESTAVINTGVQANSTASVGFQYDEGATFHADYADNWLSTFLPVLRPSEPLVAGDMTTSFISTYGSYPGARVSSDNYLLHPFPSGYQGIAGLPATCKANDPQEWPAKGSGETSPNTPVRAAEAGASVDIPVNMGVVEISRSGGSGGQARYLRAVSIDVLDGGNPGCATTQVIRWSGRVLSQGSTTRVALPFGSWTLYADDAANSTTTQANKRVGQDGLTSATLRTQGTVSPGSVTFDPRTVTP